MHFSPSIFSELPRVVTYLDPGSGSMLLQLILAAVLGLGILVRTQWSRIKSIFMKRNMSEKDDQNDDDE
jgi:hypothetical protein